MTGVRAESERGPFASIEVRHSTLLHANLIQDQSADLTVGAATLGLVQR